MLNLNISVAVCSSLQYDRPGTSGPFYLGMVDFMLPSKHNGGTLSLSYGGKEMKYQTSGASDYDCSYTACVS